MREWNRTWLWWGFIPSFPTEGQPFIHWFFSQVSFEVNRPGRDSDQILLARFACVENAQGDPPWRKKGVLCFLQFEQRVRIICNRTTYIHFLKPMVDWVANLLNPLHLSTGKVWINLLLAARISVESGQNRKYYASNQNNSKGGLPWFGGLRSLSCCGACGIWNMVYIDKNGLGMFSSCFVLPNSHEIHVCWGDLPDQMWKKLTATVWR